MPITILANKISLNTIGNDFLEVLNFLGRDDSIKNLLLKWFLRWLASLNIDFQLDLCFNPPLKLASILNTDYSLPDRNLTVKTGFEPAV